MERERELDERERVRGGEGEGGREEKMETLFDTKRVLNPKSQTRNVSSTKNGTPAPAKIPP